VCAGGACTHADNKSCECTSAANCDDANPCTDDSCNAQNKCVHTNNTAPCSTDNNRCTCDVCSAGLCTHPTATAACTMATATAVNNFDSAADWDANLSTPAQLAITGKTSFDNTNLEANSNLYLAESNTGTLEIGAPDLTGLTSLTVELQSDQSGTASMVEIGVFNSATSTWVDRALSLYGTVSQGSYGTLTIPLADFAVSPCTITKVRLDFNVTGGQKVFRVTSIAAK
jgi:hypothetical protein